MAWSSQTHTECRKPGLDVISGQWESASLLLYTELCVLAGESAAALLADTSVGRGMAALSKGDSGLLGIPSNALQSPNQ